MRSGTAVPRRVWAFAGLLLVTLAVCAVLVLGGHVRPETLQELGASSGPLGLATYVVAIVVAELLWLPRMWGLLAGGILFGPLLGGLLSLVGDLAGALICYGLARRAGQAFVGTWLERHPRAGRIVDLFARQRGAWTVAMLRVCPVAHFTLTSYAAGLAGVRPVAYLAGTALGILPGAVIYPVAGDAALRPGSPLFFVALALVAAFLVVTLLLGRRVLRN